MQESLYKLHREWKEKSEKSSKSSVDLHNCKTGIGTVKFSIGDFILNGVLKVDKKPKYQFNGPEGLFHITEYRAEYVFRVEHLLFNKKELVHCQRLKVFKNSAFEVTEEVQENLEY